MAVPFVPLLSAADTPRRGGGGQDSERAASLHLRSTPQLHSFALLVPILPFPLLFGKPATRNKALQTFPGGNRGAEPARHPRATVSSHSSLHAVTDWQHTAWHISWARMTCAGSWVLSEHPALKCHQTLNHRGCPQHPLKSEECTASWLILMSLPLEDIKL